MASIGTIKVRVGADIQGLVRGLRRAEFKLKAFGRQTGDIANGINRNLVLPFAAAGAAGVKLATDVEKNFSKIENLVGVTGNTLDGFKNSVKELSGEVGKSQAELSNALFTVTSAGLRGAEAMEVLTSASKASAIGLGDTNEVARALTGVMQSYGTEQYNAAKATDVLTAVVREGNLEAESLAPVLGRVTGLAATMGISFEEVGASIATFTRLGVSAEEAVTALRGTMTNFLKPSAEAVQQMESLGLSVTDVQDSIRNNGLAKTLIDLIKRYKGNEQALGELIPNVRALAGVLGTAGRQGEAYTDILDNIYDSTGLVDQGFENVSETSAKKFDKALVSLQNAGIELGATLLPMAVQLAEAVKGLAERFSNLDDQTKNNIVRFGALAAAVGGSLKVISVASNTFATLSGALGLVVRSIQGATTATKTFDRVLAATKIGLIIAGVTLAYQAYKFLTKNTNEAAAAQQRIERITGDAAVAIEKEKLQVDQLFGVLRDGKTTQEERKKAYDKLNAIYPDILKNIGWETDDLKKLKRAQDQVTESIIKRIAADKRASAIDNILGQVAELEVRYKELEKGAKATTDEQVKFFQLMEGEATYSQMAFDRTGTVMRGIRKEIARLKEEAMDVGQTFDEAFGEGNRVQRGSMAGYADLFKKEVEETKEAEKERKKVNEDRAKAVKQLYATLAAELRKADQMFKVHGNVQEQAEAKTDAYLSAIEGLIDEGFDAGSKAVGDLIVKMNMVQAEFDRFSSARVIKEVEKIGNAEIPPLKIDVNPPTIDQVPEIDGEYKIDVIFDEQRVTQFASVLQEMFNNINAVGGKIGKEFGENFSRGADVAVQGIMAVAALQTAMQQKKQAELDESYNRERERIQATISDEGNRSRALEQLDQRYQDKKRSLQKKAARQEKLGAISQSIINTANAVTKALTAGPIAGPILAAIVGGLGAAQTAVIASTPTGYAKGGKVKLQQGKVSGVTNATPRPDGDHILAYLKAGEAVLNSQQIRAIGPEVLAAARVPGFNTGGIVGKSPTVSGVNTTMPQASTNITITGSAEVDTERLVFAFEEAYQIRERQRGY